jgi:branched-subunit amino acid aminotransferase/4-amino-4-deoxychorismate lyase
MEMNEGVEVRKEVVGREAWLRRLHRADSHLFAMYSSVTDCITTDPSLMVVPVDDHVVHRGDGVFESFKCLQGNIYNLEDHLVRLERSCVMLGMVLPIDRAQLASVLVQTIRAGGRPNALVRLIVSRGVGTMGVNPYACKGVEFYVVVYESPERSLEKMAAGVRAATSRIPLKPGLFATVKTCNYLPNVLMKKEAVDLGVDYTFSFDEAGHLGEGATENVGIVTAEGELLMPPAERVLAGTTAKRALMLAERLVEGGLLRVAAYRPITREMVDRASEMHVYGTTPNITPVIEFDGRPVGDGTAGPVAAALFDLLREEMVPDSRRLTKVF